MPELTLTDLELLTGTGYATLVTVNEDGSPHATITWVDADGGDVLINTAAGRVKDRNLRRDPRAAVLVTAPGDAYRWSSITGSVVGVTGEGGDAHIDALSRRYDGKPWPRVEGQVRLIFRIRPEHVIRYGH